jgi:hypothetical protein
VAFCDRNGNVIAPFVSAPGNKNESPLFREELPRVPSIACTVGFSLEGSVVSLDGVYDGKENRKSIFNHGMILNIPEKNLGRSGFLETDPLTNPQPVDRIPPLIRCTQAVYATASSNLNSESADARSTI